MSRLSNQFNTVKFEPYADLLTALALQCEKALADGLGKSQTFRRLIQGLPAVSPSAVDLDADHVRVGTAEDLTGDESSRLHTVLNGLQARLAI